MSQPPNGQPPHGQVPGEQPPGEQGSSQGGWGPPQYGAPYQQNPYQQGPPPQGLYQQGPYQQGPYQQGPYPSPYTPLEGARPDRSMRWIALVVGFFAGPAVLGTAAAVGSSALSAVFPDFASSDGGLIAMAVVFGVGIVLGLVFPQTRWWALGAIIGIAVTFIVLAGACLAIIALFAASMQP